MAPISGDLPVQTFIDVLTSWKDIFVAGVHLPVMGVTEAELRLDQGADDRRFPATTRPIRARAASRRTPDHGQHGCTGSPIEDQDVPLIPFPDWSPYEEEIARVFTDFMRRTISAEAQADARSA